MYVGTDPSVKIVKECNATCRLYHWSFNYLEPTVQ